jgi:hypothetical protein
MTRKSRREFLTNVGRGMLISSVGATVAFDLGLADAASVRDDARLTFGPLERLVDLQQETELRQLLPALVKELRSGTELRTLVAAGSLANARAFGGQDYIGYHTLMAMAPALQLANELPRKLRPLPVLKVLYRNTQQIQAAGKHQHDTLTPVTADVRPEGISDQDWLLQQVRSASFDRSEAAFAGLEKRSPEDLFQDTLLTVHENADVHRVVLAWRSYAMLDITGREHASTLLRQSIRYAVNGEQYRLNRKQAEPEIRTLLPRLMDQHHLNGATPGQSVADDQWIDELASTILVSSPASAASAAADAIADGIDPEAIGEAISLAANLLLLQDPGRSGSTNPLKPDGSVHGDSVGLHASDAANAWRNIARVSPAGNQIASLIVGAYHTAGKRGRVGDEPWPRADHLESVRAESPRRLLDELDSAVRAGNQALACAVVARYSDASHDAKPVFDRLARYATSEDGALHAEKFYRTVREEFQTIRPSRRWRQLVALARVSASEYGRRAEGYEEAKNLLGLS